MDESYFQNMKRCFETLKLKKSFQKLQILNTTQPHPLTFQDRSGKFSTAGAAENPSFTGEPSCQAGAARTERAAPSSLNSSSR